MFQAQYKSDGLSSSEARCRIEIVLRLNDKVNNTRGQNFVCSRVVYAKFVIHRFSPCSPLPVYLTILLFSKQNLFQIQSTFFLFTKISINSRFQS